MCKYFGAWRKKRLGYSTSAVESREVDGLFEIGETNKQISDVISENCGC